MQAVFAPWVRVERELAGSPASSTSGTGPLGLRAKINLAGNDGQGPALALLLFAFVPTRGDAVFDEVTWGLMTPLAIAMGSNATLSAMLGAIRIDNDDTWVLASVSLGTAIAGNFAGFVELYSSRNSFEADAIDDATLDAGITYALGENWQLDAGVYRGLATETEDWRVFVGASARAPL
jgi:Putative MetA-pathway of phenol degradation